MDLTHLLTENVAPSGGQLGLTAVGIAVGFFLLKFAAKSLWARIEKLFEGSWQAVAAVLLASGGFLFLPSRRYAPAVLGLVAAGVCLWASYSKRKKARVRSEGRGAWVQRLKRLPPATAVFVVFIPVYVGFHLIEGQVQAYREQQLQLSERRVLVTFVLPIHKEEDFTGKEDTKKDLETRTFEEIYRTLLNAFSVAGSNFAIYPDNAHTQKHEELERKFPTRTVARTDLVKGLIAYHRGKSPIDIVLRSNLTLHKDKDTIKRVAFKMKAQELDWKRPRLADVSVYGYEDSFYASPDWNDVRRVALIVIAIFTEFFLESYPGKGSEAEFQITNEKKQKIWNFLSEQFRGHYMEYDSYGDEMGDGWPGHNLNNCKDRNEPCSGRHYVGKWVEAYRDPLPDTEAIARHKTRLSTTMRRGREPVTLKRQGES